MENNIPQYFETEELKKEVYTTLKQYINSARETKNEV